MSKLAKHIKITNTSLEIDGEPFPWYLSEQGVEVQTTINRFSLPAITITIPADRVETDHDLDMHPEEEWTVRMRKKNED